MMLGAKKLLLIGAGGHCLSVLDSLLSSYEYLDIGIIDKSGSITKDIMGVPVVGYDEDLECLYTKGYKEAFITVGSIGNAFIRRSLYNHVKKIGFEIPNIIDKTSIVSEYCTLGEGIYIGKNAIVNACTQIGNMSIINTSSVVEHECNIDDFVHIAPGSILCGNVHIDKETHVGAGSVIKQGIHIGNKTIIGMGSVVLSDIRDNVTAYGSPCKEVKEN